MKLLLLHVFLVKKANSNCNDPAVQDQVYIMDTIQLCW
jgi:hypothetical protein